MGKLLSVLSRRSAAITGIACLWAAVSSAQAADNDNFRIAMPQGYDVVKHEINENLDGSLVDFAPAGEPSDTDNMLRLQSYLMEYMPSDLKKLAKSDAKTFAKRVLSTRLEKECANFEVNVGRVRHYNEGRHINWWSLCERADKQQGYAYERGRIYSADYGTYIYSHYEPRKGKDFKFSVKEVKWFDSYLNNSGLCENGKNCGVEGKIIHKIFVQK